MYAYKYACTDGIQVYKDMVSSSDDEGGSCPELVSDSENDEGSWEHLRTLEAERRGRGESSSDGSIEAMGVSSSGEAIDESFHEHRITPMPRRGRSWASDATTIRGPPPTMQNISGVSADEWEELDGYGRMAARMEYVEEWEVRAERDARMAEVRARYTDRYMQPIRHNAGTMQPIDTDR
jgi:hypothetical protein